MRYFASLCLALALTTFCAAQSGTWVALHQETFQLNEKAYKLVWSAPEPGGDKAALLVRVTVIADRPVSVGFVDSGSVGDFSAFRDSQATVCPHAMVTSLTTLCAVMRGDSRKQLTIQDAGPLWKDQKQDTPNDIRVIVEAYKQSR